MRFVLDTDVVVAALRSPSGGSAALMLKLLDGDVSILLSVGLALEYEAVAMRPEHAAAAGLTGEEMSLAIDTIIALAEPVVIDFGWRPQLRDANDEIVLETAINGHADAIVTFNVRDFGDAPSLFGIGVLRPGAVLERLKK